MAAAELKYEVGLLVEYLFWACTEHLIVRGKRLSTLYRKS